MYGYAVLEVLTILLAITNRMAKSDRLGNVQPSAPAAVSHLTPSQGGGPTSFSYRSGLDDYKNLYKAPSNIHPASTSPAALLHKTHLSSSRAAYNTNTNTELAHHDFVPIVKQTFQPNSGDGAYAFSYETGNGISASEYGMYKAGPTDEEGIQSASGTYTYTGPDNIVYSITYTAGLEGFVPKGAHLPTPPPVPAEAINKVLQYANDGGRERVAKYQNVNDPGANENEVNKYQPYGAGKQPETNESKKVAAYAVDDRKYRTNDAAGTSSNKYTAAVQIPYTGYTRNTNFDRSYTANEYKVHDEFSNH